MSAPALVGQPSLLIRGTRYPVLLPTVRDPRLHLAAVIITLQVLGQTAFGFSLSIAQILVALGTCAVLEVGIAFFRQRVIMWPASALLTGNGVAFILRVPGTPHGEWWSLHGAWIFAGTAAVALLSKYVIRLRGRHIFNPSNFGLVLCFLVLGKFRAEPLDFWWGPMSPWLALAVVLIVAGGLSILSRLRLLFIAIAFWLTFAAGVGVLAASGHSMTARWHLGPISGWQFWWLLVSSPEILIFLFFMITDPKTIPNGRDARLAYAVGVGLVATLLIAPQTTEFATKVAVLGALALLCAARPLLERLLPAAGRADDSASTWASLFTHRGRLATGALTLAAAACFAGLVVLAGIPARPNVAAAAPLSDTSQLPPVTVVPTKGVSGQIDRTTALQIARDVVVDLQAEEDALRLRNLDRATTAASGAWLVDLRRRVQRRAGRAVTVPSYHVERMRLELEVGAGQSAPKVLATLVGTEQVAVYLSMPPKLEMQHDAEPFKRTVEVALQDGRYVIVSSGGVTTQTPTTAPTVAQAIPVSATGPLARVRLQNVAGQVGLDFRQDAFRFGVSNDVRAMMGGGLCWIDYDGDGWLDLFVVNSYADTDASRWEAHGGLPRSALFRNARGTFVNVSRSSKADLAVRGEGCVAADFNGDGHTDLYVTTDSYDKLLWNNGDGTFTEGAAAAGIEAFGWHTGAAVSDVNGDGLPDLFVAGYTDLNAPIPTSAGGFPSSYQGVRDLLYLNAGPDGQGRSTFREVGVQAGLEAAHFGHGLGAVFTDYNGDGRPDLYVADDEDPNQLYQNVPWPGGAAADPAGLGFRFEERGALEGADDPYAGMGIAAADYNGDGRADLFVTNSRREPHAVLRRRRPGAPGAAFADSRADFTSAVTTNSTGWGASWEDLSNDGTPDLVLANGAVPITSLAKDAERIQVLQNVSPRRSADRFVNVGALGGPRGSPRANGRGLAAADYDNNGTVDVAINSIGGPLLLLRNRGGSGHWLEVEFTTFSPGAKVTVVLPGGRRLVREAHAGSSYLSSEDPRVHFGLGDVTRVKALIVRFPDGRKIRRSGVAADRVVAVTPPVAASADHADGTRPSYLLAGCARRATRSGSVARLWDEAELAAIGRDTPAPTIDSRNLFHLSAAMWDAWAAYDPQADGYFVTEKDTARNVQAAREAAISYAAYRLLLWRNSYSANMHATFDELTATMRSLCYRPDFVSADGDSPAALGNRIAAAAIAYGRTDGSLEDRHYVDASYAPVNEPLVVSQAGGSMHDPTFWQPLALGQIVTQGSLPVPSNVQTFVGSQWGHVRGFALPASKKGLPIDPGAPPIVGPASTVYKREAVNVIRFGNRRAGRSAASFWAKRSGALSAPGRWNAIANALSGSNRLESRIGSGAARRLASDVKLYFALNGALHDAAVAAWGAKRAYQSPRPISMIRALAFVGQSSDRYAPSYSSDGVPLVPGLVELITRDSSAPGQRHAALAGHVGDIAIRTVRGWTLGTRWLPRAGGATPPYPGWISDESAFGRAAAEILAAETGSAALPVGTRLPPWGTYRRAADEAGLSSLYEGTQIAADDLAGRRIGSRVGQQAWELARRYFAGTAPQ